MITTARNEETYIEKTIQSVILQTILPKKWVIVSDGSTDRTVEIVSRYVTKYDWIELIQMPGHRNHSFAAKAKCFNIAYKTIKNIGYGIIGNLDADISFGKDYFAFLLDKFSEVPKLGVAGTPYVEGTRDFSKKRYYDQEYVHGMCQLFRRECFEEIGGYLPVEAGVDAIAVTIAKMNGWETRCFMGRNFFHHRRAGTSNSNIWLARFHYGRKDFLLGNHPFWELLRVCYQMTVKPYVLGGILLLLGYFWTFIFRERRPVSQDFVHFRRKEQMQRMRTYLKRLMRYHNLD